MTEKLCYIDDNKAWFTTQPLDKQWGDDWDDTPYEHNAGEPYEPHRDGEDWEITSVMFEGSFEVPRENYRNSPYSVQDINALHTPWLKTESWVIKPRSVLFAGSSLEEFTAFVEKHGGTVYFKKEKK